MQAYRIPNFLRFLPEKPGGEISPYFKDADDGYHSWIREKIGWLFAIEVYDTEIPLAAALSLPLASCKELRGVLDYLTAELMLEVLTDRCSSAEAVARSQLWMRTLSQCDKGDNSRHPFIQTMRRELVPNIRAAVDPFHWPQFIDSNEQFSRGIIQEALDREAYSNKKVIHDIQTYMVMRRESIGTRQCFVLMRSIRRLYIPDHVLIHPTVREMEDVALDMVFIVNDVYSFKKELGENGALHNLLTIMQKDPVTDHLDLQQRIDFTEKLFKAALDRFYACKNALPSYDRELDQYLAAYADGLIDWIAGSIQWSGLSHRYNAFLDDQDRKNYIMRLEFGRLAPRRKLQRFLLAWLAALVVTLLYCLL